jgi:hypothetical protein
MSYFATPIHALNPPSKNVNHEGHEGHEGKSESKNTLFVCESPCKSVAKKIGGGFWMQENQTGPQVEYLRSTWDRSF